MKKIAVLGSTGSVGRNALDVIARHKNDFKVVGLTAYGNARLFARQINRFKPRLAAIGNEEKYAELKSDLKNPKKILKGIEGIKEIASMKEADTVVVAISGTQAIFPIISAIQTGKTIALANKEAIVSAGSIIMSMARTHRSSIIPVDSEHNSIFQCMRGEDKKDIKTIFLMGTGGPLKDVSRSLFGRLKPSRVLAHPVWKMGKKITVDSATMMNKGLEVIEAHHLFGVDVSEIKVLFHPEALVHSMIEFSDGNVTANLFYPDMRLPIFYALNYPERKTASLPKINFSKVKHMTFQIPDYRKFPALGLSYDAAKKKGTSPACLNSANEEAVRLYLAGKIKFTGITDIIRKVLSRHKNIKKPSLDEILYVDKWAREEVKTLC